VLSHFLCYDGEFPTFAGASVTLRSNLGEWDARVGNPKFFCNPVRKTRRDVVTKIVDVRQHLKAYAVFPAPPVTGTVEVSDSNQFGADQALTVELSPSRLLVPTRKRPHDAPKGLDHFACHRVVEGKPIEKAVQLKDQFASFQTRVLRPVLHCSPTIKKHGDRTFKVQHQQAFLVCYTIERRNLVPPQTRGTRNQFEQAPITARVATRLCVPSTSRTLDPT